MKNRCIKVLQILDKYSFGGVETIAYSMINNFSCENIINYYYFLRNPKSKKEIIKDKAYIGNSAVWSIYPLFRIMVMVLREKIDILHAHQRKGFYIICVLSLFFTSKKFIYHEHGDIFFRKPVYQLCLRIFSKMLNQIIVASEMGKKELQRKTKIDDGKIVVLHNFVDLGRFNITNYQKSYILNNRNRLGIEKKDFVIGFVGRLSPVKGVEFLLKSVSLLNFNYKVLIVGDGPSREKLEKLSGKLGLKENVRFMGYIQHIEKFYPLIDVLVVPSKSESFGLIVLEAQAMKIPVIVNNINTFQELLLNSKAAVFYRKNDETDLATKIHLIYRDKDLRKNLIDEGVKHASKYALSSYVSSLERLYYELLGIENSHF